MPYLLVAFLISFIDQMSKLTISSNIKYGNSKPIIKNILYFTFVKNTGGAFSILQGRQIIFIVASTSIIICLIVAMVFSKLNRNRKIMLSIILGGAFGNYIDRVTKGYVIDFIDFRFFPIFNLADSFIFIGVLLLILSFLFEGSDKISQRKKI